MRNALRHSMWVLWTGVVVSAALSSACAAQGLPTAAPPTTASATRPATSPATQPMPFECRWTPTPITLDGKADEPAWTAAQPVTQFRRAWEGTNERQAKTTTRTKLLWDREYLYFYAEMEDVDLQATVTEHDGMVWTDDAFELFLKPAADKPGYYELNFNPENTVMDCLMPSRDSGGWEKHRSEGDFDLRSAVQLRGTLNNPADRDAGWSVEGRIAWKSLLRTGGRPTPGEQWTWAPCRVDVTAGDPTHELSSAAVLKSKPAADFHHYEDWPAVVFVGPKESPAVPGAVVGIPQNLPPLTTSKVVGSPDPPRPFMAVNAFPKLLIQYPVVVVRQPGSDRLWAVTQPGPWGPCTILRFVDEPNVSQYETLLPVDGNAYSVVFHPKFLENGYVFVGRNGPAGKPDRKCQLVRYKLDPKPPYAIDPKSETLVIEWESAGHDGLAMVFAPDGTLFLTSGDGSSDSDKLLSGQDLTRLLAKVLRIDVDHPADGKNYSVPKDNPFVGQPNVRPETWAYGMRNPWRMDLDAKTGNLWVGQNGQDHWEAVYLIEKGANYGWSLFEGSHPFYTSRAKGPHPISKPIAEHAHAEARSITGGIVYHGNAFPELQGAYLYGDYSTGKVWSIRVDANRKVTHHEEIADTTAMITSFALSSRDELLVTDSGGHRISRLERTPKAVPRPEFPKTLSASGLFRDVKSHTMADGVVPYSVIAELWSDGAYKQRYIAIPQKRSSVPSTGDDRRIGLTATRGWEFPNETVLVKSFALEAEAGNVASRKWIETRFFTRQEGEWAGYSYQWNDEQTEATLVESRGLDRSFQMKDAKAPGGVRAVNWRYPSRAECMVCHSRAANFVLGLQTLQMNRDQDYASIGGGTQNQLQALECAGMLRASYAPDAPKTLGVDAARKGLKGDAVAAYVQANGPQPGQRDLPATSSLLPSAPTEQKKLASPYDASADLGDRARSYLHANCAACHVESGGGNARIETEFDKTLAEMNLVDVLPLHDTLGIAEAKLVAPGDPARSVLLKRMAARLSRGETGQMPPLATHVPDPGAVNLITEWIAKMPPAAASAPAP